MKKSNAVKIIILIFASLSIISFLVAFWVGLPIYLEKRLLPDLLKQSGIEGFSWNVRNIGFTGAEFGSIQIGEKPFQDLSISSIKINYSLSGLFRKRLKSIHICGLSLTVELKEGKILFSGIDLNELLLENHKTAEKETGDALPVPVSFERIVIEHAVFTAKMNQKILRIPLDLTIVPKNEEFILLNSEIIFYAFGSPVHAEVRFDFESGGLKIFCDAQNLKIDNYLSYLSLEENPYVKGNMDIKAYAEIDSGFFENSTINIQMESRDFLLISNNLKLGKSEEKDESVHIKIQGEGFSGWNIFISGLALISPVLVEIPEIRGDLKSLADGFECQFHMDTILKRYENQDLEIKPQFYRHWIGFARYLDNTDWLIDLEIVSPEDLSDKHMSGWYRITGMDTDLGFFMPPVKISAKGNLEKGYANGDLKMSGIYMDSHAVSLELPTFMLNAETVQDVLQNEKVQKLNFQAGLKNTELRIGSANAKFADISLKGWTNLLGNENAWHSTFKVGDGELSDKMFDVGIKGLNVEFPLVWPPNHKAGAGYISVDILKYKEKDLGKTRASIRQKNRGGEIKGKFESRSFPGLVLQFDGTLLDTRNGLETLMNFEMPEYQSRNDFNLGDVFPEAEGIFLEGKLKLNGNFYKLGPKMTSSVQISSQDINISMKEPKLDIKDMKFDFSIADLFEFRSLPHQHVQFGSATLGNIKLDDGHIYFQMESADRFFIEKTSFKWCGGNVDTNAAIVAIPIENAELTFYCDRLKLTQVLEQLGGVNGEGEGAVNGRIPFRYHDGKISFQNGFLYSTPGDGGTIRLTGTDSLMAGIPEGTPQFSQIDLAREAMKNYQYDWAKLDITTEQEMLNLKLKLDGKPAEVLPFEYRQDFGGFVRVDADSPGSRFQGIRLDVNFSLPLDRILKYGKGLKGLFNKNN